MSNRDRIETRSNEIVIRNISGETIPALSFAILVSYDKVNQCFNVTKPGDDNISADKVIIVPEAIDHVKKGIGIITGIGVVQKTAGETIAAGDYVGTDANQWTAIEIEKGSHYVITVSTDYLVVRLSNAGSFSIGDGLQWDGDTLVLKIDPDQLQFTAGHLQTKIAICAEEE